MADEDLDKQENINRSVQERLALLEREKSTLLEEADIYKRLLGTNLDLSQVRSRYQSDEKDILQTIRTNTNILRDQSKQITFQVAEKSRIQKISNDILNISENSYSMLMEELGTSKSISDIEKKREILAKRLIELESFRGTILFEDKELQAAFNEELENSIKGASDLEAQLTDVQNTSEKIQGNVKWFDALKETSNKIGLGKFTSAFEAAEEAARETAVANELSKKVANELVAAKEEEAKAISAVQTAEEELQKLREDNKQAMLDENKQRNDIKKSLKEKEDILSKINNLSQEELETGEGLTAERLKQLGLADKVKGAQGSAAKEIIKALKAETEADKKKGEISLSNLEFSKKERNEKLKGLKDTLNQAKQEKTLSGNRVKGLKGQQQQLAKMTGKAGMKGLNAGIKALGPALKKSLGPISIVLLIKDAIDFIVDAAFGASKRTAELQRNLGIGRDAAQALNKRIAETAITARDFADTVGETSDKMGGLIGSTNIVALTSKQILQSFNDLNKTLGTNIDFTQDLGEEGNKLLASTSILRDNFSLSEQALAGLTNEALRTNQAQDDIVKGVLGEIRLRNIVNNTAIDEQQVLEDVFKLSAKTRAMFGLQTKELAVAVYEARKLGFNLEDLNSSADSLLDFENSIAKELEAELLLGKDLNLEKARQFALEGDLVGLAKELRNQNVDIVKLADENIVKARAYAEAVGQPLDSLIKQEEALRTTEAIQERLNRSIGKQIKLQTENGEVVLTAQQLQGKSLEELQSIASYNKIAVEDLANALGDQIYSAKLAESAQDKFNKALEIAKDQFANLVGSGVLQDVVDLLADFALGFAESSLFEFFAGDKAERETRRIQRGLENKAMNLEAENTQLEAKIASIEKKGEAAGGLTEKQQNKIKNLEAQIDSNTEELKTTNENQGKVTNLQEKSDNALATGLLTSSGAIGGAAIGSMIFPGVGTVIGGLIGAGITYAIGSAADEKRDAETLSTLKSATQEDGSINFEKIETDDAIIRPNEKQIVIPDKNDVIATFKPQGIIDKTLSTTKDLAQPLTTIMSPIVGTISSLFNSFTPKPDSTPESSDIDIVELAETNRIAAESYAEAMGTSLDALINKPPSTSESTTVIDNSEVVKAISLLREEVNKLNNRPVQVQSTITMDGNNVGTALGMGSYTLGNQI